ncbi:hypothetical protein [Paraburkholderia sp. PGU19]|uniref:hypothetical protein n=1 Tax=Paraburkholderia sp. PGU19 TaxID=2735434 RepID=UPI001FB11EF2|nr:hypothetical protein [Paraburkholderia sp. PGU19]
MYSLAMQPDASSSPRRSGTLLQEPRFPILTLDESKLTPALGYVFRRKWLYPHESLISILWKFEKANALSGAVVARLMGPDVDPYEGVAPRRGIVDVDRLRENLGLPGKLLHSALIEGTERQRYSDAFRFCRHCLTLGYHSVVHQLESLSQCPAHHGILESRCRRCGHETPHRISVRLLEARYRCANCLAPYARYGWTPYNAQPMRPEHRKAFTRRYLERCRGL